MIAGLFIIPFAAIILAFANLRRFAILFSIVALFFELLIFYFFAANSLLIRW